MDIITTSLDALLQRATNPQNLKADSAAVEAFLALINKEKDGAHVGVKLIASRIHSQNEKEVLLTLQVLETCMSRCGSSFQAEVGKFRFLNEMIKLVSPKYLGSQTPVNVKQRILQLMYVWTIDYPKEMKIKEAYDMLKKQGVIKEVPSLSVSADCVNSNSAKKPNSIFQDEEKSKLLQYLLQSKNPEDLQAANRLIKSMVKEDDKRAELKSKRHSELQSVHNNARLLNEMLDSYSLSSSQDELDLINELRESCERLKQNLLKLASESSQNEEMLNEILHASDEINTVFEKYTSVIVQGNVSGTNKEEQHSLLDLESTPVESAIAQMAVSEITSPKDVDVLCDIFNSTNIPDTVLSTNDILLPELATNKDVKGTSVNCEYTVQEKPTNKLKALEELDALGELLLKENLQSNAKKLDQQFNKNPEKIPMNLLAKQKDPVSSALNLDLNCLIDKSPEISSASRNGDHLTDDVLVDITDEKILESPPEKETEIREPSKESNGPEIVPEHQKTKLEVKLSDIFVTLESIKPSAVQPLTVLDEKNGISVTLHFARDKPKDHVSVVVVTTVSKNELGLSNYLFQAVVPKGCKLKLQPPSGTELPAFNPFLPPSAITQIMLIANPDNLQVSLKFIVSYVMDDETITEMGEVEKLPIP